MAKPFLCYRPTPPIEPDTTAPTLVSATLATNGTTLTVVFDEAVVAANANGFTLTPSGGSATLVLSSGSGTTSLVFTVSRAIQQGEIVTLAYSSTTGDVADVSTNELATFAATAVTNNSTQGSPPVDVTPPEVDSAEINPAGTTLTIIWTEIVTGSSGLTLSAANGAAVLTYATGIGTTTYTYSIHRPILDDEVVTLNATSSNIEDAAGNNLANFTGQAITNNSTAVAGSGTSLRPIIFPTIPTQATDAGFSQNDLSTSVRTDVVGTTRAATVDIAAGTYSVPYVASVANRRIRLLGNVTFETAGISLTANNITVDLNGFTLTYKSVSPASVVIGTVVTATDPNYPRITVSGLTLSANSHLRFVVEFLDGAEAGNHYEVIDSTATYLDLENHSGDGNFSVWQSGGPAPGDTFRIYNPRLTFGVGATNRSGIEIINGTIVEGDGYGRGSSILAGQGCNPIFLNCLTGNMIGGVSVIWHADNCIGIFAAIGTTIKYCEVDDQGSVLTHRHRTIGAIVPGHNSLVQYCRIINHRHAGIACGNNTIVEYIEAYGDSRATNAYCIGTYSGQGNIWRYCNIYKVGEHPECIAIHSNPAQNNQLYGIWGEAMTTRSSVEYGWNHAIGVSDRWDNGARTIANTGSTSCFITYTNGNVGTPEGAGGALWVGSVDGSPGENYTDCFFGAYSDDDSVCHALALSAHNKNFVATRCTFASTHNPLWFGDGYGPCMSGGRLIDCTVLKSGSDPAFATYSLWDYIACNVDVIGMTYGTGTAEDDIYILTEGYSAAQRINFGDNLAVTVTEAAVPVVGATVVVKDVSNNTLRTGYTTGVGGTVDVDVPNHYRARPGFGSTTLNALTVEATSGASDGSNTISPSGDDTITVEIS